MVNYQGRLMNPSGNSVPDGTYQITFRLYSQSSGGSHIWSASTTNGLPTGTATSVNVTVQNGLFTILLGGFGQNSLDAVDFNQDTIYLGVKVAADSEMTPRKRLAATPYAFNSEALQGQHASDTVATWGGNVFSLTQNSANSATATRSAFFIKTSGTSNANDFLIRGNNGTDVFTITRQGNVTTTGNLQVNGSAILNGSLAVSATSSFASVALSGRVNSNLLPFFSNTYDLGSATYRWRNLWANSVTTTWLGATTVSTTNLFVNGQNVTSSVPTLNQVANKGNVTTKDIQFGGGTSTKSFKVSNNFTVTGNTSLAGVSSTMVDATRYVSTTNLNVYDLAQIGGLKITGNYPFMDGGGYSTVFESIIPNSTYWNTAETNLSAYSGAGASYASYVGDDGSYVFSEASSSRYIFAHVPPNGINGSTTWFGYELSPLSDNLQDLGRLSYRWRNLYLSNNLFASGTVLGANAMFFGGVTTTNLFASGVVSTTALYVNGTQITGSGSVPSWQQVTNVGATTSHWISFAGASSSGSIVPSSTLAYDLGSSDFRWRDLWVSSTYIGASTWNLRQNSGGSFVLADMASGLERITVDAGGNVGIGTSTPAEKLDVAGNIRNVMHEGQSVPVLGSIAYGGAPGSFVNDVAYSGRYAYVTRYRNATPNSHNFTVIDVTQPGTPLEISSKKFPDDSRPLKIALFDQYAMVSFFNSSTLAVLDLSDPTAPTQIATTTFAGLNIYDIDVNGRYAYVAKSDALAIFDLLDPRNITQIASVSIVGGYSVYVRDGYAYVAGGGGLTVVDVHNPKQPTVKGNLAFAGGGQYDVFVNGRYAYVANYNSEVLASVDVSNPSLPVQVATTTFQALFWPSSVVVSGRYAYVGSGLQGGLAVVDLTDPSNPGIIGYSGLSGGYATGLAISGRYLYTAVGRSAFFAPASFGIMDIGGSEINGLMAHSAEVGSLNVLSDAQIANQFTVHGGLNVGAGGILSDGALGVSATSSLKDVVFSGRVDSDLLPFFDDAYGLGSSAYRWRNLWANNATTTNLFASGVVSTTKLYVNGTEITGVGSVPSWQQVTNVGATTSQWITFAGATSTGNIVPETTNALSLGTSSKRWSDVWGANVHIGTSTWDLSQAANGRFSVSRSSNERLSILTNGNVGVGTTTPGYNLEVAGSGRVGNGLVVDTSYFPIWDAGTPYNETEYASAVVNGGKMYVFGGYDGGALDTLFIYDTAGDSWTSGTADTGNNRRYHTAVDYNNKMWVFGGLDSAFTVLDSLHSYDYAGDTWTAMTADTGFYRESHSAVQYGGKMYVFGGNDDTFTSTSSMRVYNLGTDTWSAGVGDPGYERYNHSAVVYGGKMYVFGGVDGSLNATSSMRVYDFGTDTWSDGTADGLNVRERHTAAVYGGKMYVYGGTDGVTNSLDSMRVYDFGTDTWSDGTADTGNPRKSHVAAFDGNKMYVYGGGDLADSYLNTLSIFDATASGGSTDVLSLRANGVKRLTFQQGNVMNLDLGKLSMIGGNVGIGTTNPLSALDVTDDAALQSAPILTLGNKVGEFQVFNLSDSPNWLGLVGSKGDLAVVSPTMAGDGEIYIKQSGNNNSFGWEKLLTTNDLSGAFMQGGNSFFGEGFLGTNDAYNLNFQTNGTVQTVLDTSGNLYPFVSDANSLGLSSNRWKNLFAANVSSTNIDATGYVSTTQLWVNGTLFTGAANTLQQVTDAGATTTDNIRLIANLDNTLEAGQSFTFSTSTLLPGLQMTDMIASGNYLYVSTAEGSSNLHIYDVSNKSNIVSVSTTTFSNMTNANRLFLAGNFIFATDPNRENFEIIDVSDVRSPVFVTSTYLGSGAYGYDVAVSGKYVFVTTELGLRVFDISDINNPFIVATNGDDSSASYLSGSYLYAVDANYGVISDQLQVVDVRNPLSPSVVATINVGFNFDATDVYVQGGYAYVVGVGGYTTPRLRVVDIHDLTSAGVIYTAPLNTYGERIVGSGRYLYVSDQEIFDVADSANPVSILSNSIPSTNSGIYTAGRYTYSAYNNGVGGELVVMDNHGIETNGLLAHNALLGSVQVLGEARFMDQLNVVGGLNVGNGGIITNGSLATQSVNMGSTKIWSNANGMQFSINDVARMQLGTAGELTLLATSDTSQLVVRAYSPQSNSKPLIKLTNQFGLDLTSIHSDNQQNLFVGYQSGVSNSVGGGGIGNYFIGYFSGNGNTIGARNIGLGSNSLRNNPDGTDNIGIGANALYTLNGGINSVGIGSGVMYWRKSGVDNVAVGHNTMLNDIQGSFNTAIGGSALANIATSTENVAVGYSAGAGYFIGTHEIKYGVFIGKETGIGLTTGADNNTMVGYKSGYNNSSAPNNTFLGYKSGFTVTTGASNTFIGTLADATLNSVTNSMALGAGASVTSSNIVRVGNGAITSIGGYRPWSNLSDVRLKRDINDSSIGLPFIRLLETKTFKIGDSNDTRDGFIAQDVLAAMTTLGTGFSGLDDHEVADGGYYYLDYSSFVIPLTNSVKTLDSRTDKLAQGMDISAGFATGTKFLAVNASGTVSFASTLVKPLNIATSSTQGYDSGMFTMQGSGWDSASSTAVTTNFKIFNRTVNATTSELVLGYATGSNGITNNQIIITNEGGMSVSDDLTVGRRLFLGNKTTGIGSTSTYIFVDDTLAPTSTYIATNADGWQASTAYDYAERYVSDQNLEPGDVVAMDPSGINKVKLGTGNGEPLIGIVSTKPGFITGAHQTSTYPIALAGRVPTKVSSANGAIRVGDYLTISNRDGVAMKATKSGEVVGIAFEAYDKAEDGLISVFVKPQQIKVYGPELVAGPVNPQSSLSNSTMRTGLAKIMAGSNSVNVKFQTLGAFPVVSVTPYGQTPGGYWIEQVTDAGFTLVLAQPTTIDLTVGYSVSLPTESGVSMSDNTQAALDTLTGQTVSDVQQDIVEPAPAPTEQPTETTLGEQNTSTTAQTVDLESVSSTSI